MKKKYMVIILVAVVLTLVVTGGTLASGYVESKQKMKATISEKSLEVAIVDENRQTMEEEESLGEDIVPGGILKLNRSIINPAHDGYDIYARVSIYYSWDKMDDTTVYSEKVFGLLLDGENLVVNTEYENAKCFHDWLVVESNPGEIVMYYTKPIKPGETVCFLNELRFDANMDNQYAGAKLTLDYEVEAVQASQKNQEVSQKAIAAEWGVFATIENYQIISISESRNGNGK